MTWPKRMAIAQYIDEGFVQGSQPCPSTVKKRIKKGQIPGEMQGGVYYVWVGPNNQLMAPGHSPGDALADAIMQEIEEEYGEDAAA
jgi:hypothetical protein